MVILPLSGLLLAEASAHLVLALEQLTAADPLRLLPLTELAKLLAALPHLLAGLLDDLIERQTHHEDLTLAIIPLHFHDLSAVDDPVMLDILETALPQGLQQTLALLLPDFALADLHHLAEALLLPGLAELLLARLKLTGLAELLLTRLKLTGLAELLAGWLTAVVVRGLAHLGLRHAR
jgi:hypothetical protein